ncbi:hypothetical protein ABAC460_13325 [Asticcacaulis sp. AC460]|uniref:hypothetical protein n=1 Tax=Asticcacaulis sp. AC460 TaxID=1282360 RepID=UPI0003C3EA22|nr:hypothetical protein [Asticcacaulis sp. AC460]ESQ89269.1 hypothetical protein ABAC460_13325 [Asticcacaulis sp. AC460]
MPQYVYRLIDQNTGEEVYASDGFTFAAPPLPEHRINDPELRAHYGAPAVVNKVETSELADGQIEVRVYIDGVEERVNGESAEENYRVQ